LLRKTVLLLIIFAVFASLTIGCGQNSGQENGKPVPPKPDNNEPVKLMVYSYSAGITDSEFDKFFVKPVQAKFPNISFELVQRQAENNTPEQIIASGNLPDLILTSNVYIGMFHDLGLGMDLTNLAKMNNLMEDRFDKAGMGAIRQFGEKGELFAVPFSMNYGLMLYNKDIFDKFGVAYPKDGMNWQQAIELAKQLTRSENGTQYIGIDPDYPENLTRQYSLPYVDAKQVKPLIDTDGYKKVFTTLKAMYEIPGFIGPKKQFRYKNGFFKDKIMAMYPAWGDAVVGQMEDLYEQGQSMNWDLTTYPSFADRPGIAKATDLHLMMISPKSKHPKEAFKVIAVLTSDEAQMAMNRTGRMTVLESENVKKTYAADLKSFQGKNVQAIFKTKSAAIAAPTDYDLPFKNIIRDAAKDMAQNGKDVNTILREAQDKAEKAMAEIQSGKK
jgi:multiple sugar transport system substrate-binding protein